MTNDDDYEIIDKIEEFTRKCEAMLKEKFEYPSTLTVKYGVKFAVVTARSYDFRNTTYAFVAMKSFDTNKTLGPIFRGDIHRAASPKMPAKHSRGNIFDANPLVNMNAYGVNYLDRRKP